ncbi:hypothetical protein K491DRAFT_722505 [Lophiostoma macrostomum CBS 122681]|uniref:Uncharacterized protein n=1 Tax=Lophiostoma macrostomum CBS 122681 TaxID=1314788 RepID=A0A6A6SPG4_9PLEO|nr:hypothetical protein K491DRAFT_722505 [Lophiostoma macrostomum CBS 122681]
MRPLSGTSSLDSDPFRYSQFLLPSPIPSPLFSTPSSSSAHSPVSGPPPSNPPPPVPPLPSSVVELKIPRHRSLSKEPDPFAQPLLDEIHAILNETASIAPGPSITPVIDPLIEQRVKKRVSGLWDFANSSAEQATKDAERLAIADDQVSRIGNESQDSYFTLQPPKIRSDMQSSDSSESPSPDSEGRGLPPAPSPGVATIARALQLGLRGGYGTPPVAINASDNNMATSPDSLRHRSYAESGVSSIDTVYSSDDFDSYEPSAMTEEDRRENARRPPLPSKSPLRPPTEIAGSTASASTVRHERSLGGESPSTTYWEPSSHFSYNPSYGADQNSSSEMSYDDYHNALRSTSDVKVSIHSLSEDDRQRLKAMTDDHLSQQPSLDLSRKNTVSGDRKCLAIYHRGEEVATTGENARRAETLTKDADSPLYGHAYVEGIGQQEYREDIKKNDAVGYQPHSPRYATERPHPASPPQLSANPSLRRPPQRSRLAHLQQLSPSHALKPSGRPDTADLIGPNKTLRDQAPRPYEELEDYGRELQFQSHNRAAEYLDARAGGPSQWQDPEVATTIYPSSFNFRSSVVTDDLALTQILEREHSPHATRAQPNELTAIRESGVTAGRSTATEAEDVRVGIKARFDRTMIDYIEHDRPMRREILKDKDMHYAEKQMRLRGLDDDLKKKVMLARDATGYDFVDNETAIREAIHLRRSLAFPAPDPSQPRSASSHLSSSYSTPRKLQKATIALRFLGRLGKVALSVPTDPALKSSSKSHPDADEELKHLKQLYPTILFKAPSAERTGSDVSRSKSAKKVPHPWTRFAYQDPVRANQSDDWVCRGLEGDMPSPQPQIPAPAMSRSPSAAQGSGSGTGSGTGTGTGKYAGKGKEPVRYELFPPLKPRPKTPVYATSAAPTMWPDIDLGDLGLEQTDPALSRSPPRASPHTSPNQRHARIIPRSPISPISPMAPISPISPLSPLSPVREKVKAEDKEGLRGKGKGKGSVKGKEVPVLSPYVFNNKRSERVGKMSPTSPGSGTGGGVGLRGGYWEREREGELELDSAAGSSPRTVVTAWPEI